jgi:DNA-binding winged helix-turn-helix (wHTH) protein
MGSTSPFAFGPFIFDSVGGVLSKHGRPVALQSQPARVLAFLIERAGEVVTRDQLRHAIWGDTWVNFDQGLNYCIRQIRIALDDDARRPCYLQTLPQRGYRFIGPMSLAIDCPPRPVLRPTRMVLLAAGASSVLLSLGALAGLHTARTIARELKDGTPAALSEHLTPFDVVQGAWTHHLKPLILP